MEADGPADKKTHEPAEGAATAVQAKHGDRCSAKRDQAGPTSSTSFDDDFTEPPTLPCSREDALVDNGATAPKSCLSLLEIHTPTAAGGLLPAGKTSTKTRITFYQPRLGLCPTEETNPKRTSIQHAPYYSSLWRMNSLFAGPRYGRVIETKLGQTLVFDPGGSIVFGFTF